MGLGSGPDASSRTGQLRGPVFQGPGGLYLFLQRGLVGSWFLADRMNNLGQLFLKKQPSRASTDSAKSGIDGGMHNERLMQSVMQNVILSFEQGR